jgi:SAM-dependent methyltransferase
LADFSERAELRERMDGPCSYEELRACLRDIAKVNRLTFADRPTLTWLARAAERRISNASGPHSTLDPGRLRIVDVGCGYGDTLRRIERWAAARNLDIELTGVDLNPDAVRAAREATPAGSRIEWVAGDVYSCVEAADIVLSSLLTHHLAEAEIVRFLEWMERTARIGWFVNDLHRQALPYHVFRAVAAVARWHPFVHHDGPASIRRSFVPEDWRRLCAAAGLEARAVTIAEFRPARLCVGRVKHSPDERRELNLFEARAFLLAGHGGPKAKDPEFFPVVSKVKRR